MWAPRYYTINDFILELSNLQLADPLTLMFRLFTTIREVTSTKETFDSFYYYCEIILADFDDIDKYHVNAKTLYRNLSDIKAIGENLDYLEEFQIDTIRSFWKIFNEKRESAVKEQFISVWETLGTIYTQFGESLEAEGLAYEGKAYRKAVERLRSGAEPVPAGIEVVFAGFNALNRSEELVFDWFKTRGNTLFFWDYDPPYIENDLHEAGFFLKRYLSRYPQPADFPVDSHTNQTDQKITTISVPSPISQVKIIDKCLEIAGSTKIESPLKTAIILADESLLLPVVNSLPDGIDTVNISMGYPVIDTPAYNLIMLLADLHRNKRKAKKGNEFHFYHLDFFSVLNHSFLDEVHNSEKYQLFQAECKRKNLIYINPVELPVTHDLLERIFQPITDPVHFGRYLREIIEAVTEHTGKKGDNGPAARWQLEILYAMYKALMRAEVLLETSDLELSFSTVLNLLKRIIKGLSVPFSGEPLSGLQVLGLLETRTLDFETVVLLSMNEGKLPRQGHAPSFIPFSLRDGFGLPTLKHQDAIYGYYFYRLLHRSKHVVLVYSSRNEGLQKGEPSRFIYQLRYERPVPNRHIEMGYRIDPQIRKRISIAKTGKVYDVLRKYQDPGGTSYLSPSALNTYIECRLRFYYKYIREIAEPSEINEQIEADIFGRVLHKAMAILYHSLIGQDCDEIQIEGLINDKGSISRAIKQAFADEFFIKEKIEDEDFQGRNLIIRNVIEKYIEGILAYDKKTVPHAFTALEQHYHVVIRPGTSEKDIRIGGLIDRLEIRDGLIRVIDYKTGSGTSEFSTIRALFDADDKKRNSAVFQTFLYSWILSKLNPGLQIQPLLYYLRTIYQNEYTSEIIQSADRSKHAVGDFLDFTSGFETELNQLLGEIFDSSVLFTQTKDTKQCSRCTYNEICLRSIE